MTDQTHAAAPSATTAHPKHAESEQSFAEKHLHDGRWFQHVGHKRYDVFADSEAGAIKIADNVTRREADNWIKYGAAKKPRPLDTSVFTDRPPNAMAFEPKPPSDDVDEDPVDAAGDSPPAPATPEPEQAAEQQEAPVPAGAPDLALEDLQQRVTQLEDEMRVVNASVVQVAIAMRAGGAAKDKAVGILTDIALSISSEA